MMMKRFAALHSVLTFSFYKFLGDTEKICLNAVDSSEQNFFEKQCCNGASWLVFFSFRSWEKIVGDFFQRWFLKKVSSHRTIINLHGLIRSFTVKKNQNILYIDRQKEILLILQTFFSCQFFLVIFLILNLCFKIFIWRNL